jgi:hypothetical protein
MTYILTFTGVFISMFLVDICWAKYFIYVSKNNPLKAATWGSMILLFGAFTTMNYIEDKTLLIAAVLGGFFGTYFTVYREKKKIKEDKNN